MDNPTLPTSASTTAPTPYLTDTRMKRIRDHHLAVRVGSHVDTGAGYAMSDLYESLTPKMHDLVALAQNPGSASDLFEARLWNTLVICAGLARAADAQLMLITLGHVGGQRYKAPAEPRGDGWSFAKIHSVQNQGSKILARLPFPPEMNTPTAMIAWVRDAMSWVKRQIDEATL
jgi:hypothetical protein